MGGVWRQYGRADARWQVRDPNIISLELLTVFLMGPLCLYLFYLIYKIGNIRSEKINTNVNVLVGWRHVIQIIVCVSELYGGWMTFCPEWVDENKNLDGSTFILLWVRFIYGCVFNTKY